MKRVSKKQAKRNQKLASMTPPADGLCEWCHQKPDFRGLQKHHKKRRSDGQDDRRSNIAFVCYPCANGKKGHKTEVKQKDSPEDRIPQLSGHGLKFPHLPKGHTLNIKVPEEK